MWVLGCHRFCLYFLDTRGVKVGGDALVKHVFCQVREPFYQQPYRSFSGVCCRGELISECIFPLIAVYYDRNNIPEIMIQS